MRCEEAGEWFGIYQDLPEDSADRHAIDMHVQECKPCAEEFKIWQESAMLIHELPLNEALDDDPMPSSSSWVNENVMNRIYAEQNWYLPTVRRTYAFTYSFRKKVAGILAALLALFICGFLYTTFGHTGSSSKSALGSEAFAATHQYGDSIRLDIPVASLSDPIMLSVSPAMPEYWVALSIVGMIMTMLILNWFSRVRS